MPRKNKSIDEAIKLLENNNCKILQVYKDNYCIHYEDNEGYRYSKNVYNILRNKTIFYHKYDSKNIYQRYNVEISNKEVKIIKIEKDRVYYVCKNCGKETSSKISDYIRSEYKVCSECIYKIKKTRLSNKEDIFKEVKYYGFELLNDTFKGTHEKLDIIDIDGYKGSMPIINIRKGSKISRFAKYNKFALENLKHYCDINGINCIIPNQEYLGWDLPLKIVCECGKEFTTTATHFIHDNQFQCLDCSGSKSNNEKIIQYWLESNNIDYIPQYKFDNCRYKKPLPFDFYIKNKNICIEVDGEGHETPIKFHGIDIDRAKELFEKTKLRDNIKNNYCENNKITLLRISYKDIKNKKYKEILSSILIH